MPTFLRPKRGRFSCDTPTFVRWALLPYGQWVVAETGRTVLFNRDYCPIWQRLMGQEPEPADPGEWIKGPATQIWFYRDKHPEKVKRARAIEVLRAWDLPVPDKSAAEPYRLRYDRYGNYVMVATGEVVA